MGKRRMEVKKKGVTQLDISFAPSFSLSFSVRVFLPCRLRGSGEAKTRYGGADVGLRGDTVEQGGPIGPGFGTTIQRKDTSRKGMENRKRATPERVPYTLCPSAE